MKILRNQILTFCLCLCFFVTGCKEKEEDTDAASSQNNYDLKVNQALRSLPDTDSQTGQYLSARYARQTGDWEKASLNFAQITSHKNTDTQIWRKHLFLSLVTQDQSSAKKAAQYLFKNDPDYDLANITVFIEALGNKDLTSARQILKKIEAKESLHSKHYILFKNYLLPVLKAWLLLAENKTDEAMRMIDTLTRDADFTPVYALQKAFMLDYIKRTEMAEKYYALAFSAAPVSRMAQAAGNFYERTGQTDKAKALYERYDKVKPKNWLSYEGLQRLKKQEKPDSLIPRYRDGIAEAVHDVGGAFFAQNMLDIALYYNSIALLINPQLEPAHYMIADIYTSKGYTDEAISHLVKIEKDSFFAYKAEQKKAEIYYTEKDYQKAIAILEKLREKQPGKLDATLLLARAFVKTGDHKKALSLYNTALNLAVSHQKWLIHFERGQVYQESNEWAKAESDFLKALELNSDNPILLNHIGYSWVERNENIDQAKVFIKRALEFDPSNPYYLDSLATIYYLEEKFTRSAELLQSALSQLPNDTALNDHLGNTYWKLGKRNEAKLQWQRSLNFTILEHEIEKLNDKIQNGLVSNDK
jgi:tetratricopeptide (TPR) repeat protein